jgi:hypothetical protein
MLRWILSTPLMLCVLVGLPALLAPHVSAAPVRWAYRAYHPFMYRYPAVLGHESLPVQASSSKLEQSLQIARLMIELK